MKGENAPHYKIERLVQRDTSKTQFLEFDPTHLPKCAQKCVQKYPYNTVCDSEKRETIRNPSLRVQSVK